MKTFSTIIASLLLLVGLSWIEIYQVGKLFHGFSEVLQGLYKKTEAQVATYEDGRAVKKYWADARKRLYVWIPHTAIDNVDYQLNEALGYLSEENHEDALPKLEVLIELSERVPANYLIQWENIF